MPNDFYIVNAKDFWLLLVFVVAFGFIFFSAYMSIFTKINDINALPVGFVQDCFLTNFESLNYTCSLDYPKVAVIDGVEQIIVLNELMGNVSYAGVNTLLNQLVGLDVNASCIPTVEPVCLQYHLVKEVIE